MSNSVLAMTSVIVVLAWVGYRIYRRRREVKPEERRRVTRQEIGKWAIFLAALYLSAVAILWWIQEWLIFPVWAPYDEARVRSDPTIAEVHLEGGNGQHFHALWRPLNGARWVAVYLHGSGGNVSQMIDQQRRLAAESGIGTLAVDYPGLGRCPGRPSEEGCYAAAEAGFDWLTKVQHIPPQQIAAFGESFGGGPATGLAVRRPVGALILMATYGSYTDVAEKSMAIFPVRWILRTRFDNQAKLAQYRGPLLILHGDLDPVIPIGQAESNYRAAISEPKKLLILIDVGHAVGFEARFWKSVGDFLADLPGDRPPLVFSATETKPAD